MKLTTTHKIILSVTITTIALIFLYRHQVGSAVSDFKKKLISTADSEFAFWNANGKRKENDPAVIDRLQKYWKEGSGTMHFSNQQAKDAAWSATFISYLMRIAGAGASFPYATSHSTYIVKSIKNRKEKNDSPFKGYKPSEVKVEVGDLVCHARNGSGANYDTTGSYESHCDLVTRVHADEADMIGGNVSDSVSRTKLPLTKDGKVNSSKYFVVIKNSKK